MKIYLVNELLDWSCYSTIAVFKEKAMAEQYMEKLVSKAKKDNRNKIMEVEVMFLR